MQSDFGAPIIYPFADLYDDGAIKGYAPLYYQMAHTDEEGQVDFRVDGGILTDIIGEYWRKVHDGGTLDNIFLYIRVFYSWEYSGAAMTLPYIFLGEGVNYPVDFGFTEEFVLTDKDFIPDYCNPTYKSVMAEGVLHLRKDDLMLLSGYLEISSPDGFWSGVKIVEADVSGDEENGYVFMPEPIDSENWMATKGIMAGDEIRVEMAVYDAADNFTITDGLLVGEVYEPYTQFADAEADVLYYHGYETYGDQFERFVPGTYNIHYDIDPIGTDSFYYNLPDPIVTGLLIKSPYSYSIDYPTHLYSLPNLISTDPQTQVSFDNGIDYWKKTPYETNYPTLTADLSIRNLTEYIPNYNNTDGISVLFQVNGFTYDYEFTTNTTPHFDDIDGSYHLGIDYQFEVPLKFMDSLRPNITIQTFFTFDPTMNVNWTLEEEVYIETHIDSEGVVDWTAWYETVEGDLVNKSYDEYQMGARYEVIVENLTIWETRLRDDGQRWQFSNEFDGGSSGDFWTYLNGTTEDTISPDQIVSEMGADGYWDYNNDEVEEEFFAFSEVSNKLSISIGDPAFDNAHYWNPNEIELWGNMSLNASTTIYSFLTVEEKQWNKTIEVYDFHQETYQSIDGFVLPVDTLSGQISTWNHSVRSGSFDTSIAATIPRDAVQIGLYAGESIEIYRDQVYMPYDSSMQWSFRIPNFENIDLSSLNVNVSLSLTSPTNLGEISWNSHATHPLYLNTGTCEFVSLDENVLYLDAAGFDIPEEFWSHWTTMSINVSVLSAPTDELISIALLDGWIEGHENVIQISNAFPESLRAKLFSSNFLYFYTQRALTPSVGADRAFFEWNDNVPVDDIYYQMEASNDLHGGNLMDIAEIMDWETFYSDTDRYNQVEEWNYDEESKTYAQLEELFNNPKKGTYAEFGSSDNLGQSMAKIMLDDHFLSEINDFGKYSCFLNLYDVDYEGANRVLDRLLAKHKITIMIQPTEWVTQPQRTVINSDTGGNTYSTDIGDRNINMSYVANVTNQVALSYYLPGQSDDVMITNWQSPMEHFDAPAMDTLSTLDDKMFYDVDYYSDYFDLLVWSGDIGTPKYDGTDIAAPLSPDAGGTDMFFINIADLYDNPSGFDYMNLPFAISNTSNIASVRISLLSETQERLIDEISLDDSSEQFFQDGFYDLQEHFGRSIVPSEIMVFITYKDEIRLSQEDPLFYLMGLGLYHGDSVATVEIMIEHESTEIKELLYPTIWNSEMAPLTHSFEFNVTEDTEAKILHSIRITTPETENVEMTLYSFSLSHHNTESTNSDAVYSYNFDPHQVWLETMLMSFYIPDIEYAPWTTSHAAPIIRDNDWTYTVTYDLEGDMTYDLRLQWYDGEGRGDELFETLEDGTPITYFENGVKDTLLWDFGVDGNWNIMQKWDDIISVYNITELEAYDTEYHYISRSQYQYYEQASDFTGDGIYNRITRVFRSRSFEQFYEVETELGPEIRRRTSIPNYREHFVRDKGFENYFHANTSSMDWSQWIDGFSISHDMDGDGLFEETVEQKNLFADSFTDLLNNRVERIYETYTHTRSWQEVIRNTSDATQVLDVRVITEKEQSNVLRENATFLLLGADSSVQWRETGMDENNITGTFVFEYDVPVVIDPRTNVPYCMRVDEHGVLAWFDSQDDGFYEMAFIFTEESWQDGIAVGVYLSQSGRSEVITDPVLFRLSGDDVIPTHWLSQDYGYADIMDISWDNAWDEYIEQLSNPEYLLMMGIDTLSTAAIMMGTSALLATFSVAVSWIPIVGAVIMAGSFLAYQFWLRPAIEDALSFFGVVGYAGRELGKDSEHPLVASLSGDMSYGWDALGENLFQTRETFATYTETIYFLDANPFEADLMPTNPEFWEEWGWDEDNVYAQYQVPQFWDPSPLEGTGGSLLYALDVFGALERANLFNPDAPYTSDGYEVPDLSDIPHDIDIDIDIDMDMAGGTWWDGGAWWIQNPTAFVNELKVNNEAHRYAAENNYYELYPEITPDSPVEIVLKKVWWDRMYNQEAYQRRAYHQYFYRTPTNATWDLWDRDDPLYEYYTTVNEIGRVANEIAAYSQVGYTAVEYATGDNGQPMLIATYDTTMNYTHPVVEEVDYHIMCLISKYRTGYIAGTDYNMDIFLINLGIQAIQTAIGIAAGFTGSGIGSWLSGEASSIWGGISQSLASNSFMGEMFEEIVKEALWSEAAKFVGVGDVLAEQFGEFMGGYGVVQHLSGTSLKNSFVDVAKVKQYIKLRQAVRQFESNIRLVYETIKASLNLGEMALLSHNPSSVLSTESSVKPFGKEDEVRLAQALSGKTDNMGELVDRIQELILHGIVSGDINLATARSTFDKIMASETKKFDNIQVTARALTLTSRALLAIDTFAGGNNLRSLTNSLVLKSLGGVYDGRYMYHRFWSKDGSACEITEDGEVTFFQDGVQQGESFNIYDPSAGSDMLKTTDLLEMFDGHTLVDPKKSARKMAKNLLKSRKYLFETISTEVATRIRKFDNLNQITEMATNLPLTEWYGTHNVEFISLGDQDMNIDPTTGETNKMRVIRLYIAKTLGIPSPLSADLEHHPDINREIDRWVARQKAVDATEDFLTNGNIPLVFLVDPRFDAFTRGTYYPESGSVYIYAADRKIVNYYRGDLARHSDLDLRNPTIALGLKNKMTDSAHILSLIGIGISKITFSQAAGAYTYSGRPAGILTGVKRRLKKNLDADTWGRQIRKGLDQFAVLESKGYHPLFDSVVARLDPTHIWEGVLGHSPTMNDLLFNTQHGGGMAALLASTCPGYPGQTVEEVWRDTGIVAYDGFKDFLEGIFGNTHPITSLVHDLSKPLSTASDKMRLKIYDEFLSRLNAITYLVFDPLGADRALGKGAAKMLWKSHSSSLNVQYLIDRLTGGTNLFPLSTSGGRTYCHRLTKILQGTGFEPTAEEAVALEATIREFMKLAGFTSVDAFNAWLLSVQMDSFSNPPSSPYQFNELSTYNIRPNAILHPMHRYNQKFDFMDDTDHYFHLGSELEVKVANILSTWQRNHRWFSGEVLLSDAKRKQSYMSVPGTYLDFGVIFQDAPGVYRGFLIEALGYEAISRYGKAYAAHKDQMCYDLLMASQGGTLIGLPPLYTTSSFYKSHGTKHYVWSYYVMQAAQHGANIGRIAPLLNDDDMRLLGKLMDENKPILDSTGAVIDPGMTFKELMRADLTDPTCSLKFPNIHKPDVIAKIQRLQRIFGIENGVLKPTTVTHIFHDKNSPASRPNGPYSWTVDMALWWQNFDGSDGRWITDVINNFNLN